MEYLPSHDPAPSFAGDIAFGTSHGNPPHRTFVTNYVDTSYDSYSHEHTQLGEGSFASQCHPSQGYGTFGAQQLHSNAYASSSSHYMMEIHEEDDFYATYGQVVEVPMCADGSAPGTWVLHDHQLHDEHHDQLRKEYHSSQNSSCFTYNSTQTYSISPDAVSHPSPIESAAPSPTHGQTDSDEYLSPTTSSPVETPHYPYDYSSDGAAVFAPDGTLAASAMMDQKWMEPVHHASPASPSAHRQIDEELLSPHMIVPSQQDLVNSPAESQDLEQRHHHDPPPMDHLPLPPGMKRSHYLPLPSTSHHSPPPDLNMMQYSSSMEDMRQNAVMVKALDGISSDGPYFEDDENTQPSPEKWTRYLPTNQRRQTHLPITMSPQGQASASNAPVYTQESSHRHRHIQRSSTSTHRASSPRATLRLSPLPRKLLEKKPALACLFCRGRKIACGPPLPGSKDKTCNQCARRHLQCEYPKESRRGMRKRKDASPSPPPSPTLKASGLRVVKAARKG